MKLRFRRYLIGSFLIFVCVFASWFYLNRFDETKSPESPKVADVPAAFPALAGVPVPSLPDAQRPSSALVAPPGNVQGKAAPSSVPSRLIFSSAWGHNENPFIAAFDDWASRFLAASPAEREALLEEGVILAQARRQALAGLIKKDPKEALASSVPMPVRAQLPSEIVALLEERVSGEAQLSKLGVLPRDGETVEEPTYKKALVNGREYRAYSYGRRDFQATKPDVSVLGVAVDGVLAVSDSPLRVLDAGEVPALGQSVNEICPISGDQTPVAIVAPLNQQEQNAVEVAGTVYRLCHIEHVVTLEERLVSAEDKAGPYKGSLRALAASTSADGGQGTSGIVTGNQDARPPVAWSTGTKKVLVIRVDFSDKPGTPVSDDGTTITPTYVANLFNQTNGINDFYKQGSYNKTDLSITEADVTAVYRMPKTAAYYGTGDGTSAYDSELHLAAQALAAGTLVNGTLTGGTYTVSNYQRIGVVFSDLSAAGGGKINYGGLGEVTGDKFWINGSMTFKVCAHEIGHNFGANHCNLWQVPNGPNGDPIAPFTGSAITGGTSTEYGDPYGVMGKSSADIKYQFDMWEKSILNWLPDASVRTITTSGTYRVYRFDHVDANITSGTANALALKVVKDSITDSTNGRDYWIGLRQMFPTNNALTNGAYVLWGYNKNTVGNLLDMTTPGSNSQDAALAVGSSFFDSTANIAITPIARGGTSPNEYLDVQVNFGAPSGAAPVITGGTIAITGTATARQGTTFSVNATDADGDTLAYSWDFGAGLAFTNSSTVSYTWAVGGTYNVTVSVSDMKGHTTTATRSVTVADPLTSWSARSVSTGTDAKFNALATNGTQVLAVGEDFTTGEGPAALSSNGVTWSGTSTATLGYPNSAYGAAWDGSKWVVAGLGYTFPPGGGTGTPFGQIQTSTDAVTWTSRYLAGSQLNAVVASGTLLVAVGDGGTIIRSTNGTTWSTMTSGTTKKLASVTYGGGKFVAVGYGSGACAVLTSPDGTTWTDVSSSVGTGIVDLRTIVYGGTLFVASGLNSKIRYSFDATNFATTRTTSEHSNAIAYGNGLWFVGTPASYLAVTPATVDLISTDGQNWTSISPGTLDARNAAIFFKNTFITVGDNHSIRQSGVVSSTPNITVPATLTGTVGTPITGGTVTSDQTVTFAATGLPSGITINSTSGVISGTPTVSGTSAVTVSGSNANGTGTGSLSVVIQPQAVPTITAQPTMQTLASGGTITLSVTASGTGPFSYQWLLAGGTISGATLSTYTLTNAGTANAGSYAVTVSNAAGSVTSGSVAVVVNVSPAITVQPVTQTLVSGGTISLSVTASGTAPLSYQWLLGGGTISGATLSSYTLSNASGANAGSYAVTVSNVAGSVTSNAVAVVVNGPPAITLQPVAQTLLSGGTISLSVTASGTAPLGYQWLLNGGTISGATLSSYILNSAGPANAGSYAVTVSNVAGSVTSGTVAVVVNVPPSITVPPVPQTLVSGGTISLSVTATGTAPLGYQWSLNGGTISGATLSTYILLNAGTANAGSYGVTVSNVAGSVTSGSVAVVVNVPPAIVTQPVAQTLIRGGTLALAVTASGTAPLNYQWALNGGTISGATLSSYGLLNVGTANAGSYAVTVSNVAGSVTSGSAAVAVNIVAPTITAAPATTLTGTVGTPIVGGQIVADQTVTFTSTTLPAGLSLDANTGLISGTPTTVGTLPVTVSATNQNGVATKTFDIVIQLQPVFSITGQPGNMSLILGTTASVPITLGVDANVTSTTYQLRLGGTTTTVGPIGTVTAGSLSFFVPLRFVRDSGLYQVQLTRVYGDASTNAIASGSFQVTLSSWNNVAGRYEGLLSHNNGTVGDGAVNRGKIVFLISKTGAVSGNVQYVEAELLSGGSLLTPPARAYVPVTRTFSGALTPVAGTSLKFSFARSLGSGSSLGRQQLQLDVDLSVTPPLVKATVTDHATITAAVSAAGVETVSSLTRIPLTLVGGSAATVVGKYALSGNTVTSGDNNGYVLVQIIPSGRLIWTSRYSGYKGTGSTMLNVTDTANTAVFYETKLLSASAQLASSSLLGQLRFVSSGTGVLQWTASFGGAGQAAGIEKQASNLPKKLVSTAVVPYYDEAKYTAGASFSGLSVLNFSNNETIRWADASGVTPPAGLISNGTLTLTLAGTNGATLYRWAVGVPASGAVSVAGVPSGGGDLPPSLRLSLDRTRGEWSGYYKTVDTGVTLLFSGVVTSQAADPLIQSVGWAESGVFPNRSFLRWTLK